MSKTRRGRAKAPGKKTKAKTMPSFAQITSEHSMLAMLSYLSMLVVVPLISGQKDKFVRYHAKQGFVLLVFEFITVVVAVIIPFLGAFVATLAWFIWLILSLVGLWNVLRHKQAPLPIIGKYAKVLGN